MTGPSPEYLAALEASKQHHATSKTFSGRLFRPHIFRVKYLIDLLGCKTVLDYGCGKGDQYTYVNQKEGTPMPAGLTVEQYWGATVTKFDPAWPPFAEEPQGKFDLVICTNTLATIPIIDIPWVVDRLYTFAAKAIYVGEQIGKPVKKQLAGRDNTPIGWSHMDWEQALRRDSDVELLLVTRDGMKKETRCFRSSLIIRPRSDSITSTFDKFTSFGH